MASWHSTDVGTSNTITTATFVPIDAGGVRFLLIIDSPCTQAPKWARPAPRTPDDPPDLPEPPRCHGWIPKRDDWPIERRHRPLAPQQERSLAWKRRPHPRV